MAVYDAMTGGGGLVPQEWSGALILDVLADQSMALNPALTTRFDSGMETVHLPVLTGDIPSGWVLEGAPITEGDPTFKEVVVTPQKVAAMTLLSTESAEDMSPQIASVVNNSLVRSLTQSVDTALFAASTPTNAPTGLGTATGLGATTYPLNGWNNLDPFAAAKASIESAGGTATGAVVAPDVMLALEQLKVGSTWQAPLLGQDPTVSTTRRALGLPIMVSHHMPAGVGYVLDSSAVWTVVRRDVLVFVSPHTYASTDQVLIRATMRIGFGIAAPDRIVKLTKATS